MAPTKVDQESMIENPDDKTSKERPAEETQEEPCFSVKLIDPRGKKYWSLERETGSNDLKPDSAKGLDPKSDHPEMKRMCDMVSASIPIAHIPKGHIEILGTFFVNLSALRSTTKR